MNILNFESELKSKEDIKNIKKALKHFKKTSIVLDVPLEDFTEIFNKFLIDELDIDLYAYDIVMESNPFMLKMDMTYVKDECLQEYDYIINELKHYFGKSIVKVTESYDDSIAVINIQAALRMMFSEASTLEQRGQVIRIKIDLEEIKEDSFEKYFLD